MGEVAVDNGSQPPDFFSGVVRDGKIFASNPHCNVEGSYPTAYNLGSGRAHWQGWINVDSHDGADIISDLRTLPVESDSADAVAAIHVLEHFYRWESADLLREWKRILKPGGKMILELPCMDKIFGYVAGCVNRKENMAPFMTLFPLWGDPKYEDPAMCHRWGFFQYDLRGLLEEVGMREIQIMEPRYHFPFRDMRAECLK